MTQTAICHDIITKRLTWHIEDSQGKTVAKPPGHGNELMLLLNCYKSGITIVADGGPSTPHPLQEELDLYKGAYAKSANACSFIQDEREELGLHVGQDTIVDGVPALKAQRDTLREELNEAREEIRRMSYELMERDSRE